MNFHKNGRSVMALAGLAILLASPVWGQTTRPHLPAEQMLQEILHPATMPLTSAQSASSRPAEANGAAAPSGPVHLREGSDVIRRTGQLTRKTGDLYPTFVFDNPPGAVALAPMPLLPNLSLMSMENELTETQRKLRFSISGTVTEYNGVNYILADTDSGDIDRVMNQQLLKPNAQPRNSDEMLNELQQQREAAPAGQPPAEAAPRNAGPMLEKTSGPGAVSPRAATLNVIREGSQIIDRTGRLTHSNDGRQAEFTFDSDGSTLQDPPLVILPNLKLSDMEGAVSGMSRDVHFRVTGYVTEYRGRNCILLEKVVLIPDSVQQF